MTSVASAIAVAISAKIVNSFFIVLEFSFFKSLQTGWLRGGLKQSGLGGNGVGKKTIQRCMMLACYPWAEIEQTHICTRWYTYTHSQTHTNMRRQESWISMYILITVFLGDLLLILAVHYHSSHQVHLSKRHQATTPVRQCAFRNELLVFLDNTVFTASNIVIMWKLLSRMYIANLVSHLNEHFDHCFDCIYNFLVII